MFLYVLVSLVLETVFSVSLQNARPKHSNDSNMKLSRNFLTDDLWLCDCFMMFYVFSFLAAGILSGFVDWTHFAYFAYFAYFAGQSELQRDFESQHWKQKSRRRDSGSSQPSYCPGHTRSTRYCFGWEHRELILNSFWTHRATAHAMMVLFILIILDSSWFLRHCGIAACSGTLLNNGVSTEQHWALSNMRIWKRKRSTVQRPNSGRLHQAQMVMMMIYGDIWWWWFNHQDGDEVMKLCSRAHTHTSIQDHTSTPSMLQQSPCKIRCCLTSDRIWRICPG